MPHEYPELVCAGGYVRHVTELINVGFRAERAVSPRDGGVWWVVLDAELVVHREASAFLAGLQGADRSPHTIRAYAGRAALFLGWCAGQGVDWRGVELAQLARFKHWLEVAPARTGRTRSGSTVNAILTAVCELLRFCARTGLIEAAVAERLSEPRWLRFTPPGFDAGESGQFRTVRARALKARAETPFPEALTGEQVDAVLALLPSAPRALHGGPAAAHRAADRGGVGPAPDRHAPAAGLARAGLCGGGRARARAPPRQPERRVGQVPATRARCRPATRCSAAYADYQHERDGLVGEDVTEMVLVNLYHRPLGAPMRYRAAKGFFDRLADGCGFPVRPHMLRHSAATNWVRAGVDLDVVQALLGHASLASTTVYLHARDEDKRRAVEAVAAGGRYR